MDKAAIKHKVRRLEKKFKRYNVSELGSMLVEKQEGRYRMLYYQPNKASKKEEREGKMSAVTLLNNKYDIYFDLFVKKRDNVRI